MYSKDWVDYIIGIGLMGTKKIQIQRKNVIILLQKSPNNRKFVLFSKENELVF